jgi:hypothetical protein
MLGKNNPGPSFFSGAPKEWIQPMSSDEKSTVSRATALKRLAVVPAVALGVTAAMTAAQAADNKAQFKYQTKPNGKAKCSGCTLFKPPHGCSVVTGTISPNGWCIAYAAKH